MYNKFLAIIAVALAAFGAVTADFCSKGSVEIDGNWYCQPVTAIQYSNVGIPGSYRQITNMAPDGTCSYVPKAFSGPIAPLDEEVSLHFRGPIQLKQFAAYVPSFSPNTKRDIHHTQRSHNEHNHQEYHKRAEANGGLHKKHKRQEIVATIDAQVVSWQNNWFGVTVTTTSATAATLSTEAAQMVTATIDGKVVSWVNSWFGETSASQSSSAPMNPTAQMDTATVDGQVVSWVNNWLPSPATVPGTDPTITGPTQIENANSAAPSATSKVPIVSPSGASSVIDDSTIYKRIGYYDSASQALDSLVFLGHYGGQDSGVFDFKYGASLSYVNDTGTGCSSTPQILANVTIPSDFEVVIMTDKPCSDGDCGYVRPGAVAYHGFAGADKVFLIEFLMPLDGATGFDGNEPAIWILNANIPRTLQYGETGCSCWQSGCGEFDIVEALEAASMYMKSTLHTNTPGGDSDYILRPTSTTMKLAIVFSSSSSTLHIQVLPDSTDFSSSITAGEIEDMCMPSIDNLVSLFKIS